MKALLSVLILAFLFISASSRTAEEWKPRSVYQIITDRFARSEDNMTPCTDLSKYCGGTFKGIIDNLDYIQGMGFDAIWISPVVENTPDGYHGYWVKNLYGINENFGTAEEFKELVRICHERDIWVMVDVVANHVGYVDNFNYTDIVPFNDAKYYNPYKSCDDIDWKKQPDVEICWLSGLPDLDQNHPFVRETLIDWAKDFVKTYDIDALRIDTIPHVSKGFWAEFSDAVGVYTLGEVLNMDIHYLASYQGAVNSVLNYALYSTMRNTFNEKKSMTHFKNYYDTAYEIWPDITTLGNFVNNHDNPRFLSNSTDVQAFKAALAFSISSIGLPIVYYGDEQAYNGGQDPKNRETLWPNMKKDTDIYEYIRKINKLRKESEFYKFDQIERLADENVYVFTRSNYLFAFTNSQAPQSRSIENHSYEEGASLCNIFDESDCVEVKNGKVPLTLINEEVKILAPRAMNKAEPNKVPSKIFEAIKLPISQASA